MTPPFPTVFAARALSVGASAHDKRNELLPRSSPVLAWYWQAGDWPALPPSSPLIVSSFLLPFSIPSLSLAGVPYTRHPIFLFPPNSRPRDSHHPSVHRRA